MVKRGSEDMSVVVHLRNPTIQNYSMGYEQAKRDVEIEEEKAARIKSEQLEDLRWNKKRA